MTEKTNKEVKIQSVHVICLPFCHKYGMWSDRYDIKRTRMGGDIVVLNGVEQERRCFKCGKVQLKNVWAR